LTGTIPASFQNLKKLYDLNLAGNNLSGEIPSGLGSLSELQIINLGVNALSGPIPDSLGNLIKLNNLNLWSNKLTGFIPATFGNLINLQKLYLHGNQLIGAPSSLSKLKITEMVLFPNPMSTIPYDVFAQNPADALSPTNWTQLLSIRTLRKRSQTSSMTTEELVAMCPLNQYRNAGVAAGCLAGIYTNIV
jgi:Leucine-rich repeat (LRR) protein